MTPRLKPFSILLLALVLCIPGRPAEAQNPADILRTMEEVMRGESSYTEMTMHIVRPRYEREISLRAWALGQDYSLIIVTAPARDEGTAFLLRENNIWNYDPRIDRTVRLPSSMMAQSWMGSDFTNDDLVRESDIVEDYTHEILRRETYEGREAWVIELVPKPDSPIVWGKVITWICTESHIQLKVEHYDQRDRLASTLLLDRIRTINGRELPTRMTMLPEGSPNERTVLTQDVIEFDIDIAPSFFTRQNMQRMR